MTGYTIAMILTGVYVIARHLCRGQLRSAYVLFLACLPFALVPGLTDPLYLPIPRNSPIVGGALAFLVAIGVFKWSNRSWQYLVAVAMGILMLWSAIRTIGLDAHLHGLGLEVIFYSIMLLGLTALKVDLEDRLPPPNEFKRMIWSWRIR